VHIIQFGLPSFRIGVRPGSTDGGRTSLANLKDYCWWYHHVVLHQLGWTLTAHADGTSQVRSPAGKTIRSHSPPPRPV
jgi:hypothetical protein